MLLPALGFILGLFSFALIGAAVIGLVLRRRITLNQVFAFVFASLPGASTAMMMYRWMFLSEQGALTGSANVVGCLAALFCGGVVSGTAAVVAFKRWRQ